MKPRSDLVVENADGELIVLDKDGGQVHQFNESAALIWNGLNEGLETEQISEKLASLFEVEHERALSDVLTTIEQFAELGLLVD